MLTGLTINVNKSTHNVKYFLIKVENTLAKLVGRFVVEKLCSSVSFYPLE